MEILNNIWMVLTTPNELVTELLVSPFTFLETYLIMMLFLTILNISSTKNSRLSYVISASLLIIIGNYIIPNPYNIFSNYILLFIFTLFIFKTIIFKSLISVVSSVLIYGLIGSLILNFYITICNITTDQLANTPIYNLFYLLLMYVTTYLVILILKTKNLKIILFEDIDKKTKIIIFVSFLFGAITLITQSFLLFYYIDTLPVIITFLSFISLFAYLIISIYSLTRVMKLTQTTRKLESAKEYNNTLRILHDNVRGFKHDFDNIVTTIGGYVRTNDIEGLNSYYLQLEDDCQRVNNLYLLNPELINNPRYLQPTY